MRIPHAGVGIPRGDVPPPREARARGGGAARGGRFRGGLEPVACGAERGEGGGVWGGGGGGVSVEERRGGEAPGILGCGAAGVVGREAAGVVGEGVGGRAGGGGPAGRGGGHFGELVSDLVVEPVQVLGNFLVSVERISFQLESKEPLINLLTVRDRIGAIFDRNSHLFGTIRNVGMKVECGTTSGWIPGSTCGNIGVPRPQENAQPPRTPLGPP